ncbi:recombinase family protein [Streptomyces sp. NPDC055025]
MEFGEGEHVREAIDLGVSASEVSPFDRPQLGMWLARPDDFDALVWWRSDRAIRSMAHMHELAKWAREHRKMLVFAEGIGGGRPVLDFRNPMDPMGELHMLMLGFCSGRVAEHQRACVGRAGSYAHDAAAVAWVPSLLRLRRCPAGRRGLHRYARAVPVVPVRHDESAPLAGSAPGPTAPQSARAPSPTPGRRARDRRRDALLTLVARRGDARARPCTRLGRGVPNGPEFSGDLAQHPRRRLAHDLAR